MPKPSATKNPTTSSKIHKNLDETLTFYPAYCNRLSPTWFVWVKLTIYEIHRLLRPQPGYPETLPPIVTSDESTSKPSLLLFYLNHPIQFVQIVGIVIAIEEYHPNFFLFTLDDSSGRTIDVVWWKPRTQQYQGQNGYTITDTTPNPISNITKTTSNKDNTSPPALTNLLTTLSTLSLSSTVIAKGTITSFRSTRQLQLERLVHFPSANATARELSHIQSRIAFHGDVLSKPWFVDVETQTRLRAEALGEDQAEEERAKRARERKRFREKRERRHAEVIAREWTVEEEKRREAAEDARRAGEEVRETRKRRKVG